MCADQFTKTYNMLTSYYDYKIFCYDSYIPIVTTLCTSHTQISSVMAYVKSKNKTSLRELDAITVLVSLFIRLLLQHSVFNFKLLFWLLFHITSTPHQLLKSSSPELYTNGFLLLTFVTSFLYLTQSVGIPLEFYYSLCGTCVFYGMLCHASSHQILHNTFPLEIEHT